MNMKRILLYHGYILTFVCIVLFTGCSKLLDVTPENKQTASAFWQTEIDVEAATIGCYNKLEGCVKSFFIWSEARGEYVQVTSHVNTDATNGNVGLQAINQYQINDKNALVSWGNVYTAINSLNTVIAMAPVAQKNDMTFSKQDLKYYLGECKTLRALCYFYLARTFYQLPYITQYSATDLQNYSVQPLYGYQVLDSIVSELIAADSLARPSIDNSIWPFKTSDAFLISAYAKGRVTKMAVEALLTDVYLTKNDYVNADKYASKVIGTFNVTTDSYVPLADWHTIFNPGNSIEGIFELQLTTGYNNTSTDFSTWFAANNGNQWFENRLNATTLTYKYWQGSDRLHPNTVDIRGSNGTYSKNDGSLIWKWAGGTDGNTPRTSTLLDANYIFYRFSDIYLMDAEALNRMGQSDPASKMLLNLQKARGYTSELSVTYSSVEDLEDQILDERARELAFEGKRWYDLIRIAKRQKDYLVLASRVAEFNAAPVNQTQWLALLSDSLSWYMPIIYSELNTNPKLKQNPFYIQN